MLCIPWSNFSPSTSLVSTSELLPPTDEGASKGDPSTLHVELILLVAGSKDSLERIGVTSPPPSPLFLVAEGRREDAFEAGTEGTEAILPSQGADVGESSPRGDKVPCDDVEAVLLVLE